MDDAEFNLLLDKATFQQQTNSFIELYHEEPNQTCSLRHEALPAADTEDWLKLEGDYAFPKTPEVCHRLRLLLFHRDIRHEFVEEAPLPFRRTTFKAIHQAFGLPKHFLRVFQDGWGSFAKFTATNAAQNDAVSFVMRSYPSASVNFSLAISYDIQKQLTCGILAGLSHADIQILTTHLRCLRDYCDNPMLLPLIICLMTTDRDGQGFDDLSTTLAELEQLSGLHHLKICRFPVKPIIRQDTIASFIDKPEKNTPPLIGQYSKIDNDLPSKTNYDMQVRQLNEISTSIHLYEIRVEYLLRILGSICDFIKHLDSHPSVKDHTSSLKLEENAQFLKSTNQNMLGDVKFQSHRASNQINVVYSLINQRSARLNLAVAADSKKIALATKKDSSAMKTISFLSILFLPGTFFATLFSMSMFDWQADSVVSKWIWVYAVLTLPVTLILLGIWLIYTKKSAIRHKAEVSAVTETYGDV